MTTEIIYFDANSKRVESEEQATSMIVRVKDESGKLIKESFGIMDAHEPAE